MRTLRSYPFCENVQKHVRWTDYSSLGFVHVEIRDGSHEVGGKPVNSDKRQLQ